MTEPVHPSPVLAELAKKARSAQQGLFPGNEDPVGFWLTPPEAVNALAREEMIDLLLTSYWDKAERAKSYLHRLPVGKHKHLFATNPQNEGFFLIWQSPEKESVLNRDTFREIVAEAKAANLGSRYHVYASIAPYTGSGLEFYKIPDKVLENIGGSVSGRGMVGGRDGA